MDDSVRLPESRSVLRDEESGIQVSHLAAWCIAGSIGWAAAITGGWVAVGLFGRLIP